MFTSDATIDLIQTGKKNLVNTVFAKNETLAKALNEFVDAQTAYTKDAYKAGTEVFTKVNSEVVKMTQEAAKYDWAKAFDNVTKAITPSKK